MDDVLFYDSGNTSVWLYGVRNPLMWLPVEIFVYYEILMKICRLMFAKKETEAKLREVRGQISFSSLHISKRLWNGCYTKVGLNVRIGISYCFVSISEFNST